MSINNKDLKKKSSISSEQDDDFEQLTTKEKIKDFIEDHSDSLGCLIILFVIGGLIAGGTSIYNHIENNHKKAEEEKLFAQNEAKVLEPVFVQTLLTLTPYITKENASHTMQAAKHLLLMIHEGKDCSVEVLCKKYLNLYTESDNNVEFQNLLMDRLDIIEKERKQPTETAKKVIKPILIQKSQQTTARSFEENRNYIR